jgi:23S rRNA (cytosine1962-C5)-methyltransferase
MSESSSPGADPPTDPTVADPAGRRVAVRVTKDALRQIRGGHPWVFDSSITSVRPEGQAGDLAVVFDDKRDFAAIGLYDPDSPIRIKVLHVGKPTAVDREFWRLRLLAAFDKRSALEASPQINAYRAVHGENDGLPGLVLDRYVDTWVLKIYSPAWFTHLDAIVELLAELVAPDALVLRLGRQAARGVGDAGLTDGMALIGSVPTEPVVFRENDLAFEADVVHGQKTGFFLDQRDNRKAVRSRAVGRRVLDVFSSTGGFSVNAAAGGATSVHSVDISAPSIEAAKRNMARNAHRPAVHNCVHETTVGDAVEVMRTLADRHFTFDLVIVDPPSFASRQDQVPGALDAYARLTELAAQLLAPRGTLVQASCSSRVTADDFYAVVDDALWRQGVKLVDAVHLRQPVDHPVGFAQGAYLKAVVGRIEKV